MKNIFFKLKSVGRLAKKIISGEHEMKETIAVDVWYPDHAPRTESSQFRHSRHQIIDVDDQPCWICGSKQDRELHHRLEWAYANCLDWDKVKVDFPNYDWSSFKEPVDFIDGARDNFIVLCKRHHTRKNTGVHMLPWPVWIIQRYVRDDFDMFGEDLINK